jgi:hypothetical protein
LFTSEYLTQERRQNMNDLVDAMNDALAAAVERAGSQVHFIDYDKYVGMNGGRYCQPGRDESRGNGANLPYAFFYQMKTEDEPWFEADEVWADEGWKLKLRQMEDGDFGAVNGTLGALYGAMIQQAIDKEQDDDEDDFAALEDDNVNPDLDAEVDEVVDDEAESQTASRLRSRSVRTHLGRHKHHKRFASMPNSTDTVSHAFNFTMVDNSATSNNDATRKTHDLGFKVYRQVSDSMIATSSFASANTTARFGNSTAGSSSGTVVANSTHILLANNKAVRKVNVKKLVVSDQTSRVFHPTQLGHSLIANMILYQMAADNAGKNGTLTILSFVVCGDNWRIRESVWNDEEI